MKTVITGTIHQGNFEALKQIMRDQSSCLRYAYQRIHKDNLTGNNDVVKACKPVYMDKKLNLVGRGFKIALTEKAYSYFKHLYRVIEMKVPAVTPPCLNST